MNFAIDENFLEIMKNPMYMNRGEKDRKISEK